MKGNEQGLYFRKEILKGQFAPWKSITFAMLTNVLSAEKSFCSVKLNQKWKNKNFVRNMPL